MAQGENHINDEKDSIKICLVLVTEIPSGTGLSAKFFIAFIMHACLGRAGLQHSNMQLCLQRLLDSAFSCIGISLFRSSRQRWHGQGCPLVYIPSGLLSQVELFNSFPSFFFPFPNNTTQNTVCGAKQARSALEEGCH